MFKRELQLTSLHRDSEVTKQKKAARGGRLAEVAAWQTEVILRFEQAFRGLERT